MINVLMECSDFCMECGVLVLVMKEGVEGKVVVARMRENIMTLI